VTIKVGDRVTWHKPSVGSLGPFEVVEVETTVTVTTVILDLGDGVKARARLRDIEPEGVWDGT
jgi:hypothetical protein